MVIERCLIALAATPEEVRKFVTDAGLTDFVSGRLPSGGLIVASGGKAEEAVKRLGDGLKGLGRHEAKEMINQELEKMRQEAQVSG